MAYLLRDKDPQIMRDAFRVAINIENKKELLGSMVGDKNLHF